MFQFLFIYCVSSVSNVEEDVQSLEHFSTELVVEAAVKTLEIIQPGHGIPMRLPQNVAAKFHVCTSIAETCKVSALIFLFPLFRESYGNNHM